MRRGAYLLLTLGFLQSACGDSDAAFSGDMGVGGSAGTSNAGSGSGGDASGGNGTGGGASGGTGAGGSASGGSPGTGGSSGSSGASGTGGSAGSGGAPTCPGTAPGCVIDWAGTFGTSGASGSQDGVGQAAVFGGNGNPRGITGDGTYIYTSGDHCIRRIGIDDANVVTIAGQCGTPEYANATGGAARFNGPDGLATDGTTLWVADALNYVIRAVDLGSGDVTTLTGQQGSPGLTDGDSSTAEFEAMLGLTYDGTYLYITEGVPNESVRRIDPLSGDVDTIAGGNGAGAMNGTGQVAQFSAPRKLGTDGTDLFIADTENHLVRRIVLGNGGANTHAVTTFAGSVSGHMDAVGLNAEFRRLRGVTFDGTDLIIADSDNCVIRKIAMANRAVTTIAGTAAAAGALCANHAVGIGSQAEFNKPMDIHYDPGTGDLFMGEGSVVRRMFYK